MRLMLAVGLGMVLVTATAFREAHDTVGAQGGGANAAALGARPAGTAHVGKAFRFNKVKDGIYHAIGTGALTVIGNSTVLVNDNDVTIIDDHASPAAAYVLLQEIRDFTDKPVRDVINTHFHYDHAHGNQVFGAGVDIIGHEFTRDMLAGGKSAAMPLFQNYVRGLPAGVQRSKTQAAAAPNAEARTKLEAQALVAEQNVLAQAEFRPVPPNVTLRSEMTIHRGSREIQIRHLGRGHTAGDVVVYLPRERVVVTGDFLTSGLSNMSDSFPQEWVAALDALKKLDFDTVIPGHGDAFTDKAKIDYFQAYLRDVWTEVGRLKKEGASTDDASKRADLTRHKDRLPVQAPGVPLIGVERIYALIDGTVR
jgi:cyclase